MRGVCFGIVIAVIFTAHLVHGHGVTYAIVEKQAIAVQFGYADGEPMSYAETKVFGPESTPDLEFQNGRTDARGVCAFVPDRSGSWRVEASDSQGHKGTMEISVEYGSNGLRAASDAGMMQKESVLVRILFAVSVIANITFVLAVFKYPKKP